MWIIHSNKGKYVAYGIVLGNKSDKNQEGKNMREKIDILLKKYISVLVVFVSVLLIAMVWWNAKYQDNPMEKKFVLNDDGSSFLPEITDGQVVSQIFSMPGYHIKSISVVTVTFGKNLSESDEFWIKATLKEKNESVIKEWKISSTEIVDNAQYVFELDEDVTVGINYVLTIETEGAIKGNSFSFRISEDNNYAKGKLQLNGEDIDSDLCMSVLVEREGFAKIFFWIMTFVIALLCALLRLVCIIMDKKEVEYRYGAAIAIIGTIYMLILPPLTGPDATYHFANASKVADFLTMKPNIGESGVWMRNQDLDKMYGGINAEGYYNFYCQNRIDENKKNEYIECSDSTWTSIHGGPEVWIQGIVMAICRLFRCDSRILILLSGWINLLFYTVAIFWSIRIIPYGKNILGMVSLTPMLISLLASYNYDSFNAALIILFFALSAKFIYQNQHEISKKEWIVYCIIAFFFVPVKMVYVSFLVIEFLIPRERFKNRKQEWLWKIMLFGAVAVGIAVFRADAILDVVRADVLPQLEVVDDRLGIQEIIHIWANTLVSNSNFFIQTMIGSLLARLNIPLSNSIILGFGALLVLASINEDVLINITNKQRMIFRVVMISGIFIMLAFATVTWNNRELGILEGLQGRYFIPYLIVLPWVINWGNKKQGDISNKLITYAMALHILAFYEVIKGIFSVA